MSLTYYTITHPTPLCLKSILSTVSFELCLLLSLHTILRTPKLINRVSNIMEELRVIGLAVGLVVSERQLLLNEKRTSYLQATTAGLV